MKTTIQLLAAVTLFFAIQSCGGDDASGEDTNDSDNTTNSEVSQDQSNDNDPKENNTDNASSKEDKSYHISLDSDIGELGTGMTTGKVTISDAIICTVGEWKMRVLTDEFNPNKMVGNIYNAHIISSDYNSMNCSCQMMNVEETGKAASVGEYVKIEGEVTCDEGAVTGTFVVQMIDQEK